MKQQTPYYMTPEIKEQIKSHLLTLSGSDNFKAASTGVKFNYSMPTIKKVISELNDGSSKSHFITKAEREAIIKMYPLCEGKSEAAKYNSIAVKVKRSYASIRNIILASK